MHRSVSYDLRETQNSFVVSSRLIESLILFPSSSIVFSGIVGVSWKWVSRKLQQHPRKALLSSEEASRLSERMARAHTRKSRLLKTAAEITKLSRRNIFVVYKRFPMTQREMSPRNGAQQQLLPTLPPQQHHRYIHTGSPTKPTQNHLKTQNTTTKTETPSSRSVFK